MIQVPENATTTELEQLYNQMLSAIVLLARLLGKPNPIMTREDRRRLRADN